MGQAATVVAHPTATYPAGQLLYTEFEHIKYGCLNLLLRGLMTLTRRIFKNIFLFSKTFLYINITPKTKQNHFFHIAWLLVTRVNVRC